MKYHGPACLCGHVALVSQHLEPGRFRGSEQLLLSDESLGNMNIDSGRPGPHNTAIISVPSDKRLVASGEKDEERSAGRRERDIRADNPPEGFSECNYAFEIQAITPPLLNSTNSRACVWISQNSSGQWGPDQPTHTQSQPWSACSAPRQSLRTHHIVRCEQGWVSFVQLAIRTQYMSMVWQDAWPSSTFSRRGGIPNNLRCR